MDPFDFSMEELALGKRVCWLWALMGRLPGVMDACALWHGFECANDNRYGSRLQDVPSVPPEAPERQVAVEDR